MGTICEYPCRLDLWAEVVKAKNIQREDVLLNQVSAVIAYGNVVTVEEARVQVTSVTTNIIASSKVHVALTYNLILTILYEVAGVPTYQLVTLGPYNFTKDVTVSEFDPPLTSQQLRDEVENVRVIVKNWVVIPEVVSTGETSTTLSITAYADIVIKLTKHHDVIVYGEYDPEVDP